MTKEEVNERLKDIKIENCIWVIYIGIIILSYYSNILEKKYFLYNDKESKEKYQNIIIFIFLVLVIVYLYFLSDSYNEIKNININNMTEKERLKFLSFIASLFIFISGVIYLYIAKKDEDLSVELAFN